MTDSTDSTDPDAKNAPIAIHTGNDARGLTQTRAALAARGVVDALNGAQTLSGSGATRGIHVSSGVATHSRDAANANFGRALPPIEAIVPHRGTMLLLDAIRAYDATSVTANATVRAGAWYVDQDGAMPAWIGIELMAQAIAAHEGLLSMQDGHPARPGVLLGSRRYEAKLAAFPRNALLRIHARELLRSDDGTGAYDCTIEHGDTLYATAVVKVYQPHDFEAFIEASYRS
ncbi:MAG TPA: hotdog family protein [Pararobbsia sp.]|nr:hotdog family protein [Pararobbsia sp.]